MGKFFKIAATQLQPQQKRVLKKLETTNQLLVYHGLGSGKTLTALRAAEKFKLPMTVIGPASLRENFPKERKKHKVKGTGKYFSYNKPPEELPNTTLLVFDEAHRMGRLESKRSKYPDIYRGKKTIFLTGTPMRNEPAELIPLLRGLNINVPRDKQKFNKYFIEEIRQDPGFLARTFRGVKPGVIRKAKNLKTLRRVLKGKVDYYKPTKEGYPEVSTERIETTMTPRQQATYKMVMKGRPDLAYKIKHGISPSKTEAKDLNSFLAAARQVSNIPGGFNLKATPADAPKLNQAVKEIRKRYKTDKNYKGVTYSAFLGHGIHPMERRLKRSKIPYAVFTGKQTSKQKKEIIDAYNSGKIKHLLISGAGGEGLDLKGTKLLQVLEPHWNDPTIKQVIGRAIRFKSHAHLPKGERSVKIQTFINKPMKTGFIRKKQYKGADEYLEMMSKRKQALNEQFLNVLRTTE